ncbi:unnamed protein product [Hydatigera taeniaeformis]|uniref:Protein SPT2 homolog n=1 Tax=Hydatigena taeniaeformis TaxID=6205 RepID=A0A0R3X099_HYDTA|nr:unnamed protein product [Hydatigera taeniaeformis]
MPPLISQSRKDSVGHVPSNTLGEISAKVNARPTFGNKCNVEYTPTPIPKKRPSSLMDALQELSGESVVPSLLKKHKIGVKIPKVARPNPPLPLGVRKECEIPRNNHKSISNNDSSLPTGSNPGAAASRKSFCSKVPSHSSISTPRSTSKVKPSVQKAKDSCITRIAPKRTSQISSSSIVNTNPSIRPNLSTANHSLVLPSTPVNGASLHSKRTGVSPVQNTSANLPKSVQLSSAPSKSRLSEAKLVRPPAQLALQSPSSAFASKPRSLGIAAQIGISRSRIESNLPSQSSVRKTLPLNAVNSVSKAISPSNGKPSIHSAGLPTNGQRKLFGQQPSLQRQITMERPQVVTPTVRGIAAQYGSLPVVVGERSSDAYLDDESDEYASDDSFIDDTDCTSAKDYLRAVKDIHKSLHFDPNKYAKISKYDDLASMESSYRQIEKEEKLSMRLGAREDQEDMAMEAERRRRRLAKG